MRPPGYRRPSAGEESVWDYPRPPRIEPVAEVVKITYAGLVIAHSRSAVRMLETASPPTIYIPTTDVLMRHLETSARFTFCEWKGRARYWHVQVGDRCVENAAWSYPDPLKPFAALRDHVSFYPGKMDSCMLGEHRVEPQAGGFYGGWITPGIIGPFKGEPGTEGW